MNKFIKNGHVFRKYFPGAKPTEIAHYCAPTLEEEKPDAVIIHTGTNCLRTQEISKIGQDILSIVDICHNYGVNNVFISGCTYREGVQKEVRELNNFIHANEMVKDFVFIHNDNIKEEDIWTDRIHLNNQGTTKLTNNFINALNKHAARD